MRWLSYFIFAYIMLGIQLGIGAYVRYHGISPNLMLIAVVFICLNAPRDEALLGSFLLGVLQDLVTLQPMGLFAFTYGVVAIVIAPLGGLLSRTHPLSQFSVTLLGGFFAAILLLLQGTIHPIEAAMDKAGEAIPAVRISFRALLVSALFTACVALILLGFLQMIQKSFGFQPSPRRRVPRQ